MSAEFETAARGWLAAIAANTADIEAHERELAEFSGDRDLYPSWRDVADQLYDLRERASETETRMRGVRPRELALRLQRELDAWIRSERARIAIELRYGRPPIAGIEAA